MKKNALTCLLAVLAISPYQAFASDHIDGPVTTKHRVGDLTDLYAFPTPGKAGSVSIVLDMHPIAVSSNHFSEKVGYNIIVRRAEIKPSDGRIATSDEVVINCSLKTPDDTSKHVAICKTSNGLIAEARYDEVSAATGDDFRLFAGKRSDPFFFYANFATELANKGRLIAPKNDNVMARINVLSIIMDIDLAKLFSGRAPSQIALAAESYTQDSPNDPIRRLDRVGRPEITNVSLVNHDNEDIRDAYNLDRPFQVDKAHQATYARRLAENIAHYDKADGKQDWTPEASVALAKLMADDFLVIDFSKSCGNGGFFEIEKSLVQGKEHQTCGGRHPNEDIMDTYFTMFVAGFGGERVRDGVDAPNWATRDEFPYLVEPDLSFIAGLKATAAKILLGIQNLF